MGTGLCGDGFTGKFVTDHRLVSYRHSLASYIACLLSRRNPAAVRFLMCFPPSSVFPCAVLVEIYITDLPAVLVVGGANSFVNSLYLCTPGFLPTLARCRALHLPPCWCARPRLSWKIYYSWFMVIPRLGRAVVSAFMCPADL